MNERSAAESRSDAKLRQRILLVGLTGALPLFLVALLLINVAYSTPIEFGEHERRGLSFERQIEGLLESLSSYASAARLANVHQTPTEDWLKAQREVDHALRTLTTSYEGEPGRGLGLDAPTLRAKGREQADLRTLRESWQKLRAAPALAASPGGTSEMVLGLRAMAEHVADRSNLILDHDLDSFYLVEILLALPIAQQRLLEARSRLDAWQIAGAREKSSHIAVLSAQVRENDLARIEHSARRSLDEDAQFHGVSPSLQSGLPPAVGQYAASMQQLLVALQRLDDEGTKPTEELDGALSRAQTTSSALFRTAADQLDQLLVHRLRSIRAQRTRAYLFIIATLVGATVVMGLLIRRLLAERYRDLLEAQEELRGKEAQLRALGDNLPAGMTYQVARELDGSMHFLYVSAGVEHLHGVTASAVLANPHELYDLLLPEDRPALQAAEIESRTKGTPFRMVARSRRRSDGEIRWLEFTSAPRYLPEGRVVWDGIQMDVTERHLAEMAVRQSEQRFTRIFDCSPIPITLSSLSDGKLIAVNDRFLAVSGYSREEALGRTTSELNVYANPDERTVVLDEIKRNGRIQRHEVKFQTKTSLVRDNLLWVEIVTIDEQKYALAMSLDITEQKAAARQQKELEEQLRQAQKLEALGTLAGGIAHDFNNILGAIIANTELSKLDNPTNQELVQNLNEVLRASQRATVLVRQILSFSRRQKEERSTLQLRPIVSEALSLLRATLPTTIAIDQSLDTPVADVLVNATQVHQIVMNLGMNAAHAMKERQGHLSVAIDAVEVEAGAATPLLDLKPGAYVRLSISDTGHGMDAATLSRIFEPFFTTKSAGEGTGLGLSVVHGIVKEYEGVVTVDSEVGRGTTFHIYLPAAKAAQKSASAGSTEVPSGRGEHILFVDDEPALGAATLKMLERLGYRGTAHRSPVAALAALRQAPDAFAALVTDFTMPEMTGIELIRAALSIRPDLTVLLASGSTASLSAGELRQLGVHEVLNKPLGYESLARALHRALHG